MPYFGAKTSLKDTKSAISYKRTLSGIQTHHFAQKGAIWTHNLEEITGIISPAMVEVVSPMASKCNNLK
jgi:hypothetical protein